MNQNEFYKQALELYRKGDVEAAQRYVDDHFGKSTDLQVIKCKDCGEILALTGNLMGIALTGGDKRLTLEIWRHLDTHPNHHDAVVGLSHGVELPLGQTLWFALTTACMKHGVMLDEGIKKRIAYLEKKIDEDDS